MTAVYEEEAAVVTLIHTGQAPAKPEFTRSGGERRFSSCHVLQCAMLPQRNHHVIFDPHTVIHLPFVGCVFLLVVVLVVVSFYVDVDFDLNAAREELGDRPAAEIDPKDAGNLTVQIESSGRAVEFAGVQWTERQVTANEVHVRQRSGNSRSMAAAVP